MFTETKQGVCVEDVKYTFLLQIFSPTNLLLLLTYLDTSIENLHSKIENQFSFVCINFLRSNFKNSCHCHVCNC